MRTEVIENIARCAAFAALAHNGQRRRGTGIPYIVHPARVASLVMHYGGSYISVMAAWLHDVKEDTKADVDAFAMGLPHMEYSERGMLLEMIDALTKNMEIKPRQARFDAHLDSIIEAPRGTILVKLCDRIDNITINEFESIERTIEGMGGKKFMHLYFDETRYLLDRLKPYAKTRRAKRVWSDLNGLLEKDIREF